MSKNISLSTYLRSDIVQKNVYEVLGERAPQFITSVASLANTNPALKACDPKSLFSACLVAASLDLPINSNLGFAHIIPYGGVAQFQMGYKGFIQLAMRSQQFKTLNVSDVREGEYEGIDRLTGELKVAWIEDDAEREKLKVVGYVAFMRLTNGFEKSLYMTVQELDKHGSRYSQSKRRGKGLWNDDFEAMAKKTVLKLLLSRYAPLSTDLVKAIETDQAAIGDKVSYIDNQPEQPEEVAQAKERERIIKYIENAKTLKELGECEAYIPDDEVRDMYEAKQQLLKRGK